MNSQYSYLIFSALHDRISLRGAGEFDHVDDLVFQVLQRKVGLGGVENPRRGKLTVLINLAPFASHDTLDLKRGVWQLRLAVDSIIMPQVVINNAESEVVSFGAQRLRTREIRL